MNSVFLATNLTTFLVVVLSIFMLGAAVIEQLEHLAAAAAVLLPPPPYTAASLFNGPNQSRLFWYCYQFVLLFYYFGKLFGSVRLFHLPKKNVRMSTHTHIPTYIFVHHRIKKRFCNQWKLSGPPKKNKTRKN
jgi:hypothetical protein